MKYIVGVDVALRKTGILTIDESGKIVQQDVLVIKPKFSQWEAVAMIYDYFKNFQLPKDLTEVVWAVEDVMAMVHLKSALAIHAARTAATLGILHQSNISQYSVVYHTPNIVKHWLTGKRGAKKEQLLDQLKIKFPQYNYESLTEDEIDALALCLYEKYKAR